MVKWGIARSSAYILQAGVRQGGILSPKLFTVFVDDMLVKLKNSRLGCHLRGISCACLMYADDLVVISASLTQLQQLINYIVDDLVNIGLCINAKKSAFMIIGRKYKTSNVKLTINDAIVDQSFDIICLGVCLCAGYKLSVNFDKPKQKFYCATNTIFSQIGNRAEIVLALCNAQCLPILLYCTEAMCLSKAEKVRLAHPYFRLFAKLFGTFEKETLAYCFWYFNCLPLDYVVDLRTLKFLTKIALTKNEILRTIYNFKGESLIRDIEMRHGITAKSRNSWRDCLWNSFSTTHCLFVQ